MSLFAELKRRNVFRVGIAYIVATWLLLQVLDIVVPLLHLPDWVATFFLLLLIVGFIPALIFAWAFELTPDGLKKESDVDRTQSITAHTGRKLDYAIIGVLAVALAWFAWDKFKGSDPISLEAESISVASQAKKLDSTPISTDQPRAKSLAVLPFVPLSSGEDDEYFADGLTEEILNSLAQLPELLVTARTSAFQFKGRDIPSIREIAKTLGVQHIVEGSVRRSGDRLRVTAQLIRAEDEFHLWSENYDSTSEDTIAVQEDIAEQIAIALDVILDDSKRKAMQLAGLRDVEAFTRYQEARYWYEAAHGEMDMTEGLRKANSLFDKVIERVPDFPQAYLDRGDLYAHYILNNLGGFHQPGVTQDDIDNALENALRDFDLAIQYAKGTRERYSYEFDRAFLSGQWQGLAGRMARLLNGSGCVNNNWLAQAADIYGYAAEHARFARELRLCDPLVSLEWFVESRALFWAGDLEGSLAVAEEGARTAPGSWLDVQHANTLAALGRYEDAERIVLTRMQDPVSAQLSRMAIAAARGDREDLNRQYLRLKEEEDARLYWFLYLVWSGQQKEADAIVAQMDQMPENHFGLTVLTAWCSCGAPFDLEVAPNFAAKLAESGLDWPPPTPMKTPLKVE